LTVEETEAVAEEAEEAEAEALAQEAEEAKVEMAPQTESVR
jgi:hypothetical protein